MTALRDATPADRDAVLAVVQAAFSGGPSGGAGEVDIVRRTWALELDGVIELVAVDEDEVVGHVLAAPGAVGAQRVLGVAPLCVRPGRHGEGMGSALMQELVARADRQGWSLVVLLGDPGYYGRFGFLPASSAGVVYAVVGPGSPYFQVLRLSAPWSGEGEFSYAWELAPDAPT